MGNKITLPVEMKPELGMFCISLRPFHKIELIHAPPVVAACVRRVANEMNGFNDEQEDLVNSPPETQEEVNRGGFLSRNLRALREQ